MKFIRRLDMFWWLIDAIKNEEKIHVVDLKGAEYKPLTLGSIKNLNK